LHKALSLKTVVDVEKTGGITSSAFLDQKPTMFNFYGDNIHIVAYPVSDNTYSWACVLVFQFVIPCGVP
jgi:hypothetical protein